MRIFDWTMLDEAHRTEVLARPALPDGDLEQRVAEIIAKVKIDGDQALRAFSQAFDGVEISDIRVSDDALNTAADSCQPDLLGAMDAAITRIDAFHRIGIPQGNRLETAPGVICESRYLPISPVGLYIPGGSAPLISTVMMLAIPARLGGCEQVVMCTPPSGNGEVDPAVLAAAQRSGISEVFMVGGAQAIAAMAFGTGSIPKCAKIFGPGNAWVTEAKRQVASTPDGAAQDLPAGPSEVMIIADESADPEATCWDLLSQAEHGPDSQAILVSDNNTLLQTVLGRISDMASSLPRAEILSKSLSALRLIRVPSLGDAIDISNRYAPEHLIINCQDADGLSMGIRTAGSVFIGAWTPESLGDYCSGTNHVLPTYGYARAYGGLSVVDFMRRMTLHSATREGLTITGPIAAKLASAEGLDAHRMAVEYRLGQS
jgi:histidinol dehydrogenase